ncbi:hypothetical protein C8N25_101319 [Algoriphagus antarcticus]|uniref:Uncharacterized protein n=1 Tax=Algoriphagus antarcticus TaxID=238540 RepID=A0A3E0EA14_9BACT|nr:hypothetical protein C8N25_101319 [Algoriphagus antarcticus]
MYGTWDRAVSKGTAAPTYCIIFLSIVSIYETSGTSSWNWKFLG